MILNTPAFHRTVLSTLITVIFLLHVTGRVEIPLINDIENKVYDLRLKLNMPSTVDPRIVIIDIDEKSLAQEGRWPWSRDKLSLLTDILFDYYQITLLGFDVVFAEPDTSSGLKILNKLAENQLAGNEQYTQAVTKLRYQLSYDTLFADSLKGRPVVLGYYFNSATEKERLDSSLPVSQLETKDYPQLNLTEESGYGANLSLLQNAAIYGGYFNNHSVDPDGSFRRLPLLTSYNGKIYESLSLAVYRRLLGQPPLEFKFNDGYDEQIHLEAINIESLSIPVSDNATALVPYRGKQGSFKYISIADILNAEAPIEALAGKIALVGSTAAGILDLRTTPVQGVYPGVEVHANLISGMLDQSFKSKPSFMVGAEFLELIILALLVIFLSPRLSSSITVFIFSMLIVSIIVANIYLWNKYNIDNFLATPFIFLFILFSIQIYFGYFLETKKKNKLSKIFGQYIPTELVNEMSHTDKDYDLKSQNKEMTVLFSDVRNFTSISEKCSPEELSDLINQILTPITEVIHFNYGTIDKYIGDAVMAFWNAPLPDQHHAHNAIKAALAFSPVIDEINLLFKEKGWPRIDIGIGINTGLMNVGNMGSQFRMAYTVMGDAVNLGARLESLTKQYGTRIIVSEYTKLAAPDFAYLELDRVKVKGKDTPVTIFEPLGLLSELSIDNKNLIEQSNQAFSYYRQQQWQDAKTAFLALRQQFTYSTLFQLYLTRIDAYISTPPDKNWDGVFTHESK